MHLVLATWCLNNAVLALCNSHSKKSGQEGSNATLCYTDVIIFKFPLSHLKLTPLKIHNRGDVITL